MSKKITAIKEQVLKALNHPEAEDGLYFNNLWIEHEDEERPLVEGTQEEILDALKELIAEGKVYTDESGEEVIFFAAQR